MRSKKGSAKSFDTGVIDAILYERKGKRLDTGKPVDMGDVAQVNEHLFPRSGVSFGLLVGQITLIKSKPEILRQLRLRAKREGFNLYAVLPKLRKKLGASISLVSTGK